MALNKTRRFYPSPSVVTYYIGDLLIDDVFRVDFQRKVSHQPIWGYDSKLYDFIAQGKEIVTGNIIINYRYPGYLKNAINNYAAGALETTQEVQKRFEEDKKITYSPSFFAELDSLSTDERAAYLANTILQKTPFQSSQINNSVIEKSISRVKQDIRKVYGANSNSEETASDSDFFKSPIDDKTIRRFDLVVRYGFQNIPGGYIRKFKDCVLIGESETVSASASAGGDMSSSAQPILEIYPFFSRTIETIKSN